MRVAAMVTGILLTIWMFLEALLASALLNAGGAEEEATAAAGGLLVAMVVGLAAVIVLAVPHVSMVLFALGGLLSLAVAAGGYPNHWFFAVVIFMLALFAFFGRRGQLRDRREKAAERARLQEHEARVEELMRRQVDTEERISCDSCGQLNAANSRFCANCGSALSSPSSL